MSSKLVTFCIAFYINLSDDRELLCGPGLLLSTLPFIRNKALHAKTFCCPLKTMLLLSTACIIMSNLADHPFLKLHQHCFCQGAITLPVYLWDVVNNNKKYLIRSDRPNEILFYDFPFIILNVPFEYVTNFVVFLVAKLIYYFVSFKGKVC